MAIGIQNTRSMVRDKGVKAVIYGPAGIGKTRLAATIPNAILWSLEGGTLSLSGFDVPCMEIHNLNELDEAWAWLNSKEAQRSFTTLIIDSVTKAGDWLLEDAKKTKGTLQAYGVVADRLVSFIEAYKALPRLNVVLLAKQEQIIVDGEGTKYGPKLPGKIAGSELAYIFDEVYAMRVEKAQNGELVRFLQTAACPQYSAKSRSDKLNFKEPPDLYEVIYKITGDLSTEPTTKESV